MKLGIFDSGIGGLTVLKSIREKYKNLDIYYFGDTARVPYGSKSKKTVETYTKECVDFLLDKNIDMVILACNTASSLALDSLKSYLNIPVFGVIEPGAKEAIKTTKNNKVGVIGTKATIKAGKYEELLRKENLEVYSKACPLFVPLIEEGFLNSDILKKTIEFYLKDIKEKNIDSLILGCTHYPIIKNELQEFMGDINIISSSEALAKELNIEDKGNSKLELYFSDLSNTTIELSKLILEKDDINIYEVSIENLAKEYKL